MLYESLSPAMHANLRSQPGSILVLLRGCRFWSLVFGVKAFRDCFGCVGCKAALVPRAFRNPGFSIKTVENVWNLLKLGGWLNSTVIPRSPETLKSLSP